MDIIPSALEHCGQMFQVKFVPEMIQSVYLSFGSFEAARERYLLLAGNVVSNTAQEYTPSDFWSKRRTISDRMLFKINHTLWHQGYVEAMQFEIMKVSNKDEQVFVQDSWWVARFFSPKVVFSPGIFSTITFLPLLPKMEMDNGIMAKSGRECHVGQSLQR